MNKRIENNITMFKTVYSVCNLNIALIGANPGLQATYNQFVTLFDGMLPVAQAQILNRKGVTMNKKAAREKLALTIEAAGGIIRAHFDSVSNYEIFTAANVTLSRLLKMRDMQFITHAETIRELLTIHQPALAPFGVDAAYIAAYSTALTEYSDILSMPTAARNTKSVATAELREKTRTLNKLLANELDNAMLILKLTASNFYRRYKNARKIVDNGIRHRDALKGTIKGVVKDAVSGLVMEGVLIELLTTDLVTTTDALGEFSISTLPAAYTIRASKLDYEESETSDILVVKGEEIALEIMLTPLV